MLGAIVGVVILAAGPFLPVKRHQPTHGKYVVGTSNSQGTQRKGQPKSPSAKGIEDNASDQGTQQPNQPDDDAVPQIAATMLIAMSVSFVLALDTLRRRDLDAGETTTRIRENLEVFLTGLAIVGWASPILAIAFSLGPFPRIEESVPSILAVPVPLLLLLVVALIQAGQADGPLNEASEHRRGKLAALAVMILALFAFGIHKTEQGRITLDWKEIPAILIIFVLADLGVELVNAARKIHADVDGVKKSAELLLEKSRASAEEVTAEAQLVIKETKSTRVEIQAALDNLNRVSTELSLTITPLSDFVDTSFYKEVGIVQQSLGLDPIPFWAAIGAFCRSWTHDESDNIATRSPDASKLVGMLLQAFSGARIDSDHRPGSTYTVNGAQSLRCITEDAVYSQACKDWLDYVKGTLKLENKVMHIRALTSLLPTEFAFPNLWFGASDSDYSFEPTRLQALESFIKSVIDICSNENQNVDYRRHTLIPPETHLLDEPFSSYLDSSLDSWWIWDSRHPNPLNLPINSGAGTAQYEARKLLDSKFNTRDCGELKWKGILPNDIQKLIETYRQRRVLPNPDDSTTANFYSWEDSNGCELAVIQFPRDLNIDAMKADLNGLGWVTLRNWYISRLHNCNDGIPCATWSQVNSGDGGEKVLAELMIEWKGFRQYTPDVLLIGRENRDGGSDTEWIGAAISNIRYFAPECMVELVTDITRLRALASTYDALSTGNGFNGWVGDWASWPQRSRAELQANAGDVL